MIAKRFSRGDICLIAHVTHAFSQDPHFPFSEKAVIDYFERATMEASIVQKLHQQRALLATSEHKIIKSNEGKEEDVLYTTRAMIRVANAMVNEYAIPALYLKNVVSRIAEEVKDDDKKYIDLKKRFIDCISQDAGAIEDKPQRAPCSAV